MKHLRFAINAALLLVAALVFTWSPASLLGQTTTLQTSGGQIYVQGRIFKTLYTGRTVTDNATVNTWNVVSQAINANELSTNGQTLDFKVGLLGANNANTHEYQAYWAASTSVCGGTGAALCTTGCIVLPSVTNTTAFAGETLEVSVTRTSSGNQDYVRALLGGPNVALTVGTCSIADSAAAQLVFGTRNTTASAASLAQIAYWVFKF